MYLQTPVKIPEGKGVRIRKAGNGRGFCDPDFFPPEGPGKRRTLKTKGIERSGMGEKAADTCAFSPMTFSPEERRRQMMDQNRRSPEEMREEFLRIRPAAINRLRQLIDSPATPGMAKAEMTG